MDNDKAKQNAEVDEIIDIVDIGYDYEETADLLSKQLEEAFSDLELSEKEREAISNPDSLGQVIFDEVLTQFATQIGLDMTKETLIQKYDREHEGQEYKDIANSIMQDKSYKAANNAMKEQQQAGILKDAYTGKDLKPGDKANLDHVVSRKELFENKRRKQANLEVVDLANKPENLKPTNESLNKSKGAKSVEEYIAGRSEREQSLVKQNEAAKRKIDNSNMSDVDKELQKKKSDKRLQDKLDAKDELMAQADKNARKAINKDIMVNVSKNVGLKAGKDALKVMVVTSIITLLKEVINGMVRFFKEKAKSFNTFLSNMKESIKKFLSEITGVLKTGGTTFIGTIISEIFGPIVSMFKKLSSLIKQGVSLVVDVVKCLKENKGKPISGKVANVRNLIVAALGIGAIFLSSVFENALQKIPGMQKKIPSLGSIANITGIFLASLLSGVVSAIVINMIDKFFARKLKEESNRKIDENKNKILNLQYQQIYVKQINMEKTKEKVNDILCRSNEIANNYIMESCSKIFNDDADNTLKRIDNVIDENEIELIKIQDELDKLFGEN